MSGAIMKRDHKTVDHLGAYTANRAAALSGVPKTTLHYWARNGILIPNVSHTRIRLWSHSDLIRLRCIDWLRREKLQEGDGAHIPKTSMSTIKRALKALKGLDIELWESESGMSVQVDQSGKILIHTPDVPHQTPEGQRVQAEVLDLVRPFETMRGIEGPDLLRPRPNLRIVPGKLSGEPHIERTRLETRALGALARRGVTNKNIYRLYPDVEPPHIEQGLDLEDQLTKNLAA